ncbi:MAG TPA: 1-deoxy-D-xylulose-5-phosphate synthase [Acidimicrobiales bacterium]|nr:1-deoxy-D-xylulose-5-phosphate synthase [Acidimicrobiales bacterium]
MSITTIAESAPPVVDGLTRRGEGLDGLDPASLRSMDVPGLERLATTIRRFLVDSVAETGGHLGSNLGIVELTLALHRVFDSPRDAVVWDTGHQAYVHKLVTGRAGDFARLRQPGGLSGYPNRLESDHDVVENSHASTALSYAYGLARARQLGGDERPVVAVVGDGALTGGLAYEALNNIGATGTRVIVIVNDNGRSYAPTVSRLSTAGEDAAPVRLVAPFFEALGLSYQGPVDGHDLVALERALKRVAEGVGPVVLHVHTTKGHGYAPAENDDDKCLHDIGPFDPATGIATTKAGAGPSYTHAFTAALMAEAQARPDLVALTAAMPGPTGLAAFRDRYPDRFFDVGIAEQHAVTAAAGMAMGGLRPVVAIYSTFLNRAWDQIYYDVGLHRLPVIFCVDRAGVTGEDGPSHHGLLDLALLTKVPGMTVFAPASYEEVAVMLHQALTITSGPVAIRWPKTEAARADGTGTGVQGRRIRAGRDVCLLGVGKLVAACERAADLLAVAGIDATVWDVRVASPLAPDMISDARRHRVVLTAEDGVVEGGVGALVASALAHGACPETMPRLVACGVPVAYVPHGRPADILSHLGLDGPGLSATVLDALERSGRPVRDVRSGDVLAKVLPGAP